MTEERESYGDYSVDDENQPGAEGDAVRDPATDPEDELDAGYSPPEKWSAAQGFGNTPLEEAEGESLDQRLQQEEPEPDPYAEADTELEEDVQDEAGQGRQVGDRRAGRLVESDQGAGEDTEGELVGRDAGIAGAGASAEEAAVHVVSEDEVDFDPSGEMRD